MTDAQKNFPSGPQHSHGSSLPLATNFSGAGAPSTFPTQLRDVNNFLTSGERCQKLVNCETCEGPTPIHLLARESHTAKRSHVELELLFQHFPLAEITASTPVAN